MRAIFCFFRNCVVEAAYRGRGKRGRGKRGHWKKEAWKKGDVEKGDVEKGDVKKRVRGAGSRSFYFVKPLVSLQGKGTRFCKI